MVVYKNQITKIIRDALQKAFDDPVVEITEVQANYLRMRVGQDKGGPLYFNIKVVKEV